MVVVGVARRRIEFDPGEVHASALVSWVWSQHRHAVIAFRQQHPQSVQFALDW